MLSITMFEIACMYNVHDFLMQNDFHFMAIFEFLIPIILQVFSALKDTINDALEGTSTIQVKVVMLDFESAIEGRFINSQRRVPDKAS